MPNPASLDEASCSCYSEDAPEYRISKPAAPGFEMTIPARDPQSPLRVTLRGFKYLNINEKTTSSLISLRVSRKGTLRNGVVSGVIQNIAGARANRDYRTLLPEPRDPGAGRPFVPKPFGNTDPACATLLPLQPHLYPGNALKYTEVIAP